MNDIHDPRIRGEKFRDLDNAIKALIKKRAAEGLSDEKISELRSEFRQALDNSGIDLTPVEKGSFEHVFDRALEESINSGIQVPRLK